MTGNAPNFGLQPKAQPGERQINRRTLLQASAAAGGGLLLGFILPPAIADAEAEAAVFTPNAFIRIEPDSKVVLIVPQVEMGQGTYTSMPMLIAEELEVTLSEVRVEAAPPDPGLYGNPLLGGIQATGGSTSVRGAFVPLRKAGAAARMMLIAAAARRWNVDSASCSAANGFIMHQPSGRRASYGALTGAAARERIPDKIRLKPASAFTVIGTSARRLDTPAKINGEAVFGIDFRKPGMKFASLAICPSFGGSCRSVDDAKARSIRGVLDVVHLPDAVAVIATDFGTANAALGAIEIEWDAGPNAGLDTEAIIRQLGEASQAPGAVARSQGDAAAALKTAATRLDAVYQVPFLAHAAMEPMNCTVELSKTRCDIWVGTQVIARARQAAAETAGLPPEAVMVHNHLIGGGFGRRLEIDGVVRAVEIAKHVDGPVKIVWTREQDIRHDMYRPYYYDRLAAGLDAKGRPVAWTHRVTGSSIIARFLPAAFQNGLDPDAVDGAANPPYAFPNIHVDYVRCEPPGIPTAFWRGVGPTHNIFVVESFMDELAAAAKQDAVAYRRALLGENPRALAVLDAVAKASGWGSSLPARTGRGVSVQFAFGTYMAQVAEVEVSVDNTVRVRRVTCAVDCGIAVNPDTIRAQIEGGIAFGISGALWGDITLAKGAVEQSNFDSYRVLRINEMPAIDVHIIPSTEAPGGMGEAGTAALAPALTNAVFAATGRRVRKLPIEDSLVKS
jgi:isoquinoline 1-oxidoreductase beta subunit